MFVTLVIALFILSHVLTDFYIQNERLLERKKESYLAQVYHSSYFFCCSLLLTIPFFQLQLFFIIVAMTILHFIIASLEIYWHKPEKHVRALLLFIIGQLAHLFIIIASYPFLKDVKPNFIFQLIADSFLTYYPFLNVLSNLNLLTYSILVITGFLFAVRGGTILTLVIINLPKDKIMDEFKNQLTITGNEKYLETGEVAAALDTALSGQEESIDNLLEEKKKYGRIIGNIERVIIIFAILINQFTLIALLTAIKSIGRFKEIDNKTSDYYIVGTFASFLVAFSIGFILVLLKKWLLG